MRRRETRHGTFGRGSRPRWILAAAVLLAAVGGLAACVAPQQPDPTVVRLTVTASPDVNPDPQGRPSPVTVHVYRLTSPTAFSQADFFQLVEQEQATLGPELLGSDQVVVTPGGSQTVMREFEPQGRFIGVVAAFRDIDAASWRAYAPVPQNQTTPMTATVDALSVTLSPGEPGAGS
jgi:type VI secretion system protein VasD